MHTDGMTANYEDAPDLRDRSSTQRQRPIPGDTFMVRLAIARMHAGHLTIREAADRCGLNYASWSNWEQGSKPRNLLDVVQAISEALDIDEHWLLFGGPLAGPRGMPTRRAHRDNGGYPTVDVRPTDNRPPGRPAVAPRGPQTIRPEQRRAVRISYPLAA